jgi:hypothetical protein
MDSDQTWHKVLRIVWMDGGIVAVNEPGSSVTIHAGANGREISKYNIHAYPYLFESLKRQGFLIIGATFVQSAEEIAGLYPPTFYAAAHKGGWLVSELIQQWRQIAFAASRNSEMQLMDIASRIASGLIYAQMRLQDLATAYSHQLRGLLHRGEIAEYQRFSDLNSFEVHKTIHSMFWQMAVLRDNLAEFVAVFCLVRQDVTSLSGLLKSLKRNPSSDSLVNEIETASDGKAKGWLSAFTDYRNLFTHVGPIEQATNLSRAVQNIRILPGGSSIPQLYYALPHNPHELMQNRSNNRYGLRFKTFEEFVADIARKSDKALEPDALEYLHGCLDRFADISRKCVAKSPVEPKMIHLGPEDMIGGLRVNRQ